MAPRAEPAAVRGPADELIVAGPVGGQWWKLLLALVVFLILPAVPQLRAMLPIEQTLMLLVPCLAACALVGWWAGGRGTQALVWVGLAAWMTLQPPASAGSFDNLARGWSLLLGGAFGLSCLLGESRPLFSRALAALCVTFLVVLLMSSVGPLSLTEVQHIVAGEFSRRNTDTMGLLRSFIQDHAVQWGDLVKRMPQLGALSAETQKQLQSISGFGVSVFPAMLALQALFAMGLAWATYHRLGRARLGAPLAPLREFRFNDQLVWGLIVGLTILFLPTLTVFRGVGSNLLVFFGTLYAVRGLGVLAWFLAPGGLAATLAIGFAMLWWPVLNVVAVFGFVVIGVTAFGLGLGDTWADWRARARPHP